MSRFKDAMMKTFFPQWVEAPEDKQMTGFNQPGHLYFISFDWVGDKAHGSGNMQVNLTLPIRTMEDINLLERMIQAENYGKYKSVIVTNWRKFEGE